MGEDGFGRRQIRVEAEIDKGEQDIGSGEANALGEDAAGVPEGIAGRGAACGAVKGTQAPALITRIGGGGHSDDRVDLGRRLATCVRNDAVAGAGVIEANGLAGSRKEIDYGGATQ